MTSPLKRASYAPLLDESGNSLPALLTEFNKAQLAGLIHAIQRVLPDFSGVEVSQPILPKGEVYYSLTEMMPFRGRTGRKNIPIPAGMLSEGTRRITAILSLYATRTAADISLHRGDRERAGPLEREGGAP